MRKGSLGPLNILYTYTPYRYDIFAINIASTMLGYVYDPSEYFQFTVSLRRPQ